MLCTWQYNVHCPSTLARPRSVKRIELLVVANIAEHRFDGCEPLRNREPAREDFRNVRIQRADAPRDCREVRRVIAAARHEGHVLLARALNPATADDPLGVRE